jgi:hypothetical protein
MAARDTYDYNPTVVGAPTAPWFKDYQTDPDVWGSVYPVFNVFMMTAQADTVITPKPQLMQPRHQGKPHLITQAQFQTIQLLES